MILVAALYRTHFFLVYVLERVQFLSLLDISLDRKGYCKESGEKSLSDDKLYCRYLLPVILWTVEVVELIRYHRSTDIFQESETHS